LNYLELALEASVAAGERIMEVYGTSFSVELKEDKSPLTLADKESHRIISAMLASSGFPLLSEEGRSIPYGERSRWQRFWLVDPIDGTKEFIKRNGEFTVNIALIEGNRPVLGVIYAPALRLMYFGSLSAGAYRNAGFTGTSSDAAKLITISEQIFARPGNGPYTVVASRSHFSPETEAYITQLKEGHPDLEFASRGSSLKLCLIAEGSAHIYPRMGPTMEWDTAAGHAIVEAAGGEVMVYKEGYPLKYNKPEMLNPWFIASVI
jgi:3'(2'), 5'-bisphosphate nucleotidase